MEIYTYFLVSIGVFVYFCSRKTIKQFVRMRKTKVQSMLLSLASLLDASLVKRLFLTSAFLLLL